MMPCSWVLVGLGAFSCSPNGVPAAVSRDPDDSAGDGGLGDSGPADGGGSEDGAGSEDSDGSEGSSGTKETGKGDDTASDVPIVDCGALAEKPVLTELEAPRGYHDVIFDTDGNLIGSDGQHLVKASDPSTASVWLPDHADIEQMDHLLDGDMVFADRSGPVLRVTSAGGETVIATDVGAYGLIVGPDGMLYAANVFDVLRIDPDTGEKTSFVKGLPSLFMPRVLDFSPDFRTLYIGGGSNDGAIYRVPLDEHMDPTGEAVPFVMGVGTEGGTAYHDGLAVDACGNLYVNDYSTLRLFRISPHGDVQTLLQFTWAENDYTHGGAWGSGLGAWRTEAFYMPQPYHGATVLEAVVGVPSRSFNGGVYEVINLPK
jgi:hypothetical protein